MSGLGLLHDLRRAVRTAAQSPGVTLVAVITLALGIGAATAIFSLVDAVLLRPLPFAGQDRLVAVWGEVPERAPVAEVSVRDWLAWREGNETFSDLALVSASDADFALTGGGEPLHVRGRLASGNLFRLLGARAALGRALEAADDRPEAPPVVLLSHGLWQRRFGADPGILGKKIVLDGDPATVVGVMPPEFRFPRDAELWTPIPWLMANPEWQKIRFMEAIGRLKPGVSFGQARADMAAVSARLKKEPPYQDGYRAKLTPLVDEILGDARPALLLLLGAAGLLVLIACANVAGLLLARAAARRRETALRTALGASPGRLARQLLAESLVLAALAAGLGLLLARWGLHLLLTIAPADIPRLDEVALDGRALAAALLVSLATAFLFGLVPALQAARVDLVAALKEGARSSAGVEGVRARSALVVAEVALALVLLVAAGLLLRSLAALQRTDLGFEPRGALAVRITLPTTRYTEPTAWADFFRRAVERLRVVPGVTQASAVLLRPLSGPIGWDYDFVVEGQSETERKTNPVSNHERVSPGYFRTMEIPLLAGRDFTWSDDAAAPRVVIVNESMAKRYWPGKDPIGRSLRWDESGEQKWLTVVGVVGDARYREIEAVRPDIYEPLLQDPHWAMDLVVRTGGDPAALVPAVRGVVRELDRDQPLARVTTLEAAVADSVAHPRLRTLLLALFAGLALLLAAVGLAALLAYSVAQRRHEIGVRLALGADRRSVLFLIVRQGLGLTLAGLGLGLAGAAALVSTGWLDRLLYGVGAADLATFAAVPAFLLLVALAATLLPAGRATEVDPVVALKDE